MRPTSIAKPTSDQAGFSLIELLLATILSTMIVVVFVSALLTMVRTATAQKTQLELTGQGQLALDIVERDIRLATSFDTTIPTQFTDSYGPSMTTSGWSGTWSYKGSDAANRVLILSQIATTTPPLSDTRTPVYVRSSTSNPYGQPTIFNCTPYSEATPYGSLSQNYRLPYYFVYFVRDNTLYRRTLTDTTTSLCNGPQYQKRSCPREDIHKPTGCLAHDEIIVRDVSRFTIAYYQHESRSSQPYLNFLDLNVYDSNSPNIFDEANSVVVTLGLEKKVNGEPQNSELSVRVGRVNP